MEAIDWLMFGCATIFALLGAYVFVLSRGQKALEKRIRQMETLRAEK